MMNNYPIWWDTTVTVFNKHEDPMTQLITWTKHVVSNCFWKDVGNKVSVGDTILETNNIICRIPENNLFREKYLWVNLPEDERPNFFTLGVGDLLFRGDIPDIIDEYSQGHRSTDVIDKYKALQGCFTIEKVAINVGVGRNNPHYYAKGV